MQSEGQKLLYVSTTLIMQLRDSEMYDNPQIGAHLFKIFEKKNLMIIFCKMNARIAVI